MRGKTTQFGIVLVAAAVLLGAGAGTVLAATDASITADPADPETTATHTVTVTVGEAAAGSLAGLSVDYGDSGADVSDVDRADLTRVGIDRDADAMGAETDEEVGTSVTDVSAGADGATLTVSLDGSVSVSAGDEVVLVYEDVTNPEAGEWDVAVDVTPGESGGTATATLTVGASMGDSTNGTETGMDGTMNETETTMDGSTNGTETADGGMNDSMTDASTDSMTDTAMDGSATETGMGDAGTTETAMTDSGMTGTGMDDSMAERMTDGGTETTAPGFGTLAALTALVVGALALGWTRWR